MLSISLGLGDVILIIFAFVSVIIACISFLLRNKEKKYIEEMKGVKDYIEEIENDLHELKMTLSTNTSIENYEKVETSQEIEKILISK